MHNFFQIADVDSGVIRWVNADLVTYVLPGAELGQVGAGRSTLTRIDPGGESASDNPAGQCVAVMSDTGVHVSPEVPHLETGSHSIAPVLYATRAIGLRDLSSLLRLRCLLDQQSFRIRDSANAQREEKGVGEE